MSATSVGHMAGMWLLPVRLARMRASSHSDEAKTQHVHKPCFMYTQQPHPGLLLAGVVGSRRRHVSALGGRGAGCGGLQAGARAAPLISIRQNGSMEPAQQQRVLLSLGAPQLAVPSFWCALKSARAQGGSSTAQRPGRLHGKDDTADVPTQAEDRLHCAAGCCARAHLGGWGRLVGGSRHRLCWRLSLQGLGPQHPSLRLLRGWHRHGGQLSRWYAHSLHLHGRDQGGLRRRHGLGRGWQRRSRAHSRLRRWRAGRRGGRRGRNHLKGPVLLQLPPHREAGGAPACTPVLPA